MLLFSNNVNLLATVLLLLLVISIAAAVRSIRRRHTLRTVLSVGCAIVLALLTGVFFWFIFLFAPR